MEERNIKIDSKTAKEWYEGSNITLKKLALQAFREEELKNTICVWNDFIGKNIKGYYLSSVSTICSINLSQNDCKHTERSTFLTIEQAKSALAMAQITQLLPHYWNRYEEGWKPDWNDSNQCKWVIINSNNSICYDCYYNLVQLLAFPSREILECFLKYNKQLVLDYLMIDE